VEYRIFVVGTIIKWTTYSHVLGRLDLIHKPNEGARPARWTLGREHYQKGKEDVGSGPGSLLWRSERMSDR
jgi:hypothetical protein